MVCKRIICKGRVQGVFYRASTAQAAISLNLYGWVRNLPNGDVEVCVQGEESQVQKLIDWCWQGPELAHVTDVVVESQEIDTSLGSFEVRYG
jgi:acylphosphatase